MELIENGTVSLTNDGWFWAGNYTALSDSKWTFLKGYDA